MPQTLFQVSFLVFYCLQTVNTPSHPEITHNIFQLNWDQGLSKLDPLNNLNWSPSAQQTSQEVVSKVHRKALSRESSQGLWDLRRLSLLDGGPINQGGRNAIVEDQGKITRANRDTSLE